MMSFRFSVPQLQTMPPSPPHSCLFLQVRLHFLISHNLYQLLCQNSWLLSIICGNHCHVGSAVSPGWRRLCWSPLLSPGVSSSSTQRNSTQPGPGSSDTSKVTAPFLPWAASSTRTCRLGSGSIIDVRLRCKRASGAVEHSWSVLRRCEDAPNAFVYIEWKTQDTHIRMHVKIRAKQT